MITLPVSLGTSSYDIRIEPGLTRRLAAHVALPKSGGAQVIVTDEVVARHHLPAVQAGLDGPSEAIVLPAGEGAKSWEQLHRLCETLLQLGVERGDRILALGGGVVGDLTGFAASILRRGCGFVQVPTTLLAQVDSSVGGKTAINTETGKNLIGSFHQPDLVLIDPDILSTLPPRQMRAGYAEVVKYGLIADERFFAWCEDNGAALLSGDADALTYAIRSSCAAKAEIVAADEKERTGARALLNLGHTFGHALEAELGYSDALLHGEAVAIGMDLAFRYSQRLGLCGAEPAERIERHYAATGLPSRIPDSLHDPDALVGRMRQDKKASGGRVPLILARGIGEAFMMPDADLADVRAFLAERMMAR